MPCLVHLEADRKFASSRAKPRPGTPAKESRGGALGSSCKGSWGRSSDPRTRGPRGVLFPGKSRGVPGRWFKHQVNRGHLFSSNTTKKDIYVRAPPPTPHGGWHGCGNMGVAQNQRARVTQLLVLGSIFPTMPLWGIFLSHSNMGWQHTAPHFDWRVGGSSKKCGCNIPPFLFEVTLRVLGG